MITEMRGTPLMSYADAVDRTWRDNILFAALIELTYRCNLNCSFCYNDTKLQGVPLATDEYVRFFEDLRDLGTMNLTLSGGEPLAHPEFFLLGRTARDLGFLVRVKTNGHALRGKLAQRMLDEVDPFVIEVSLHGATAAVHDRQTRVAGSFDRLIPNLRAASRLGLRIKLNAPLTLWNEHEVEAMFALADDLGVRIDVDPEITGRDDGDMSPQDIGPTRHGIARLLDILQRRADALAKARPSRPKTTGESPRSATSSAEQKVCGAGSSSVTVDPFGNVYPCVQWRRRIGNLHDKSIKAMWNHSAELTEIRRLAVAAKKTVDALDTPGFGYCPGSAEKEVGQATKLYPVARLLLELQQRAATKASG